VNARRAGELSGAVEAARHGGSGALMVLAAPRFFTDQPRLAQIAGAAKLPVISAWRELPAAGGLMSYGASISEMFQQAATLVDKILKGAKLKTARALGLTLPPSLLARADQVIE
jgi:putative tryptophan/tyrosine transport system substrate-binding protein